MDWMWILKRKIKDSEKLENETRKKFKKVSP